MIRRCSVVQLGGRPSRLEDEYVAYGCAVGGGKGAHSFNIFRIVGMYSSFSLSFAATLDRFLLSIVEPTKERNKTQCFMHIIHDDDGSSARSHLPPILMLFLLVMTVKG